MLGTLYFFDAPLLTTAVSVVGGLLTWAVVKALPARRR